ncbi:MAG: hypothetical protein OXF46_04075 [Rhodobacteraceae bacterium]|nr:hypothetical protein [Paracoccaceae bacterium]
MIERLPFLWDSKVLSDSFKFEPSHCLLSEFPNIEIKEEVYSQLLIDEKNQRKLVLHPYPTTKNAQNPIREGFPVPPPQGQEPANEIEYRALKAFRRMNHVRTRVNELEQALKVPETIWPTLRQIWKQASDPSDPGKAEIIKQAEELRPIILHLNGHLRKILRRDREKIPISNVMEMDRSSIKWLARQPGNTVLERVGTSQQILAIVRNENFDTLENRVLLAYSKLAGSVAREWMHDHSLAENTEEYKKVAIFQKLCRRVQKDLSSLGIGQTEVGINPNYVLLENQNYRAVYRAWLRLLKRNKIMDSLWAWQANTWTDFVVLTICIVLDEFEESKLISQSPIIFKPESSVGRLFYQDYPQSVFWFRNSELMIEVHSRNLKPNQQLFQTRSQVFIKIINLKRRMQPKTVVVWTPHTLKRLDLVSSIIDAHDLLRRINQMGYPKLLHTGLVVVPSHGELGKEMVEDEGILISSNTLDGDKEGLNWGMEALKDFFSQNLIRLS